VNEFGLRRGLARKRGTPPLSTIWTPSLIERLHLRKNMNMTARFNIVLSDDLYEAIGLAAYETKTSKGEILRKAFQLYLIARDAHKRKLKIGFIDPNSEKLQTEIVGL
jgi:hypothetical protein